MIAVAYYTITGQTDLFIKKTGLPAHKIDDAYPQYDMG
jgi:protein involved in ribonucleotide reduction